MLNVGNTNIIFVYTPRSDGFWCYELQDITDIHTVHI